MIDRLSVPLTPPASELATATGAESHKPFDSSSIRDPAELKETFTQFVGETFFGQLIKSMRQTVGKPAYFHGGRGEEIFQGQLDQVLTEHMTEASADTIAGPMFDLFTMSSQR